MVTRAIIERASYRIGPYIRETPVIRVDEQTIRTCAEIHLKLESLQVTGSFKPRGVFNRLLGQTLTKAGVVAASGGNHGLAVAYAAQQMGIKAEIFLPSIAPKIKREALEELGAHIVVYGDVFAEALAASLQRSDETGALNLHPFDHEDAVAGQGTIAREFERQAPGLDTILVAVGGGGLIAGVTAWYRGRANVIAVEPEKCPTLHKALQQNKPVNVDTGGVAADSLGCRSVGQIPFSIIGQSLAGSVLVSEEAIVHAQAFLWQQFRIVAEPGGAVALAALLSGAYEPAPDERIGIIICGGNADISKLI